MAPTKVELKAENIWIPNDPVCCDDYRLVTFTGRTIVVTEHHSGWEDSSGLEAFKANYHKATYRELLALAGYLPEHVDII